MAKAATHKSIWDAQLAVMQEVSYVQKKGRVGEGKYGYSFAGESDLIAQLRLTMNRAAIIHPFIALPIRNWPIEKSRL